MVDEADPQRYGDYAYRADALLKSMEPRFLDVLAEHQRTAPKEDLPKAEGGVIEPPVALLDAYGLDLNGGTTAGDIEVRLHMSEAFAGELLDDLVHVKMQGDTSAIGRVLHWAEKTVVAIVTEGIETKGWES